MNVQSSVVARLSGRCADGAERGRGSVTHVVFGGAFGRALCGARPGKRSAHGFVELPIGTTITCGRCHYRATQPTAREAVAA